MISFSKDKITITIDNQDDPLAVETFWHVIMFALDWDAQERNARRGREMTEGQRKLAEKLEEISRPTYG